MFDLSGGFGKVHVQTDDRTDPIFAGPGRVRELLRSRDWSATALGPVRSWSPVLRTMVHGCLSSAFPVAIHWGKQQIALYNDAFAAMLGGKHPAALGTPALQAWPEAHDRVQLRYDVVVGAGRTLSAEDEQRILHRHGYPEECYFTYSHSPVRDLDGSIVGLFTIASETTAKVLYQRRMGVVQQLAAVSIAEAGSTAETCRAVLQVLASARQTMPFAIAYLSQVGGPTRRVADYGLAPGEPAPPQLDVTVGSAVGRVLSTGRWQEVSGLRAAAPGVLLPGPLGPLTPDTAVVVALTVTGRPEPIGALVLGVNPYRPLNDIYRAFFTVVARQVRVALTDTVAYEVERVRVQVLADLDRVKMEFLQNVSHELRTPLTLLLAPLRDMLADAADRPEPEREDLGAAVRAAERLHTMVDALLDFAGAQVAAIQPNLQPTDIAGLTADVAAMFRSAADHAGLAFHVDVPAQPVTAGVDRAMWSTIVVNLLSNALKYTPHGSIHVHLAVRADTVELTVTDTGRGIEPAEQPHIFDRFYRVDSDASPGAGIGLAVVADLVHAHHGQLHLDSTPDQGSNFTVIIPAAHQAADTADPGRPADALAPTRPHIMLVEDDQDLRTYLVRLLTAEGLAVHALTDAETALRVLDDPDPTPPDLIITDVMLPGRSGLEFIAQLRRTDTTCRLPILILTARHGADAAAQGLHAGADDYITKPFSTIELLARVRANLELARTRQAAVDQAQTRADQLRSALDSNRIIGTAVGVLMTRHLLTAQHAYQLLVATSQHTNRKLRDIAAQVAETGALPVDPALQSRLLDRVTNRPTHDRSAPQG